MISDDRPPSIIVSTLRAAGCVFAEDEAALLLDAAEARRAGRDGGRAGWPGNRWSTSLGWAEFHGLRVAVEPGVFVPRRRTEFLVRPGRRADPARPRSCSTCAAARVRSARRCRPRSAEIELHAVDIDPAAVRSARRNVPGAQVYQGDLYQPLPAELRGRVDVLPAIAPYVPTGSIALMPPEARDHEPPAALDGGADGLDVLRRVARRRAPLVGPRRSPAHRARRRPGAPALTECARRHLTARVTSPADESATVLIAHPA